MIKNSFRANSFRALMVFVGLMVITLGAGTARAQVDLGVFVKTGDPAPGTPDGVVFASFFDPVINAVGEVAFRATLTGPGVTSANDRGIWGPDGFGNLSLIAREGQQAPGTPAGVVFSSASSSSVFSDPVLNAAGEVAFSGVTSDNGRGIWGPDGFGTLGLIARSGDPAPGTGKVFGGFGSPLINAAGEVAFPGSLPGGGGFISFPTPGIWGTDGSGNLGLIALDGQPAPGTGTTFSFFVTAPPFVLNAPGGVAFSAGIRVFFGSESGIWGPDVSGNLGLIARTGDPAAGTPSGIEYNSFGTPDLNAAGEVAFLATLRGTGVTSVNNIGIWGPDGFGNLQLIARRGDLAPGIPEVLSFNTFISPVLSTSGEMVFRASLDRAGDPFFNGRSLWSVNGSGNLGLIARAGDPAPGTPTGVLYIAFDSPAINATGQVAFVGHLTGFFGSSKGVWGPDGAGNLSLIVQKGDEIALAPGSSAVVFDVNFVGDTGNEDGRPSGLSDNGQIAVRAVFDTGQQAILLSNSSSNAPPVADAGPDRTVECTSPAGAQVTLDGSGSSDPDGDPLTYLWSGSFGTAGGLSPTMDLALGTHSITLVVNDGQLDSDPDVVTITVQDTAPPALVASLTSVGEGDEGEDDDEGQFRIDFTSSDICDPAPTQTAVLVVPGIADIPVVDGQIIEFEVEDEEVEVEAENGILEIEAPSLTLRVTATDASGNTATGEVQPAGLGADNDDDTVASADLDD